MTVLKNNKKIPVWDYDKKYTYNCPHCKSFIEYGAEDIKQSERIIPAHTTYHTNHLNSGFNGISVGIGECVGEHHEEQRIQVDCLQCPVCGHEKDLQEFEVAMFIKQWRNMTDEEAFPNETEEERAYRLQRQEQSKKEEEAENNRIVFGVSVIVIFILVVCGICIAAVCR